MNMGNQIHNHERFADAVISQSNDKKAPTFESETMAMAAACLGGRKKWKGRVRGLFGILRRDIDIDSFGVIENGVLIFRETLRFDNGDQEKREWRIKDTPQGLALEASGVQQSHPAQIENGLLVFKYILSLNGLMVTYQDAFALNPDGNVTNTGAGKVFGLRILTVNVAEISD